MRRFGERLVRGQHYRPRPGAYAVLVRGGQFLITHQAEPTPEFQLPGGGIDPGEGPLTALHREVFEETGWSITAARRLGAYRRFTYMPEYDRWAEKICHIYLARPALRLSPPSEAGHEACWVTGADAMRLLANAGDRHFLGLILRQLR
ncbi:NUDIX hydrolase [Rhodobacter veldkampii DSM 11550]|uniref:NUDIX hydrolase n=1 Tax=Phaeovulum veldkampii DSM 11550 TaxID=1185920 RepID=A0A2T4JL00_9RHOB|nr:NUDIX hydrolase [Phaeovulum veldkampii]MBK5945680.1 NUDIX hydrolase [Phaeovulum veldkampii DSM 11550]PTE18571.1 NUDIX hydrolase [Phaeovulum veldkampii DSM 11550]TDQ59133.1 8-oxo-dGTP diphosphatase [Phaeovulum veldkampii DSM 11550]